MGIPLKEKVILGFNKVIKCEVLYIISKGGFSKRTAESQCSHDVRTEHALETQT